MNCRSCDGQDLFQVLDLGSMPYTGVFPLPGEEVPEEPFLVFQCDACGLVQLEKSFPPTVLYDEATYGYESNLNSSMVDHLISTAALLSAKLPDNPSILDIGCNDGTLLSGFEGNKFGIDPLADKWSYTDATVFKGLFPQDLQGPCDNTFDLITSIAVFYATPDPRGFTQAVANMLKPGGVWFVEQGYLPMLLKKNAYDVLCHEHVTYFKLKDFVLLAERAGLRVQSYGRNHINGESLWVKFQKPVDRGDLNDYPSNYLNPTKWEVCQGGVGPEGLQEMVANHAEELRVCLSQFENVIGYGASTKGNVMLHAAGITKEQLPFIAEVNPQKVGRVTPGTNIPIISEAAAHAMNPDAMLVLPWHFKGAILKREAEYLAQGGKLIFPLPYAPRVLGEADAKRESLTVA